MSLDVRWVASASASCYYAADLLLRRRPLIDTRLAEALVAPVDELEAALGEKRVDPLLVMSHVVPMSAGVQATSDLAETALRKTLGPPRLPLLVDRVANALAAMQSAVEAAMPGLVDELALRAEPIRGQWEARGPGLLAGVTRWTEPAFLAERADVVLVHPAQGGGGLVNHLYNSVCIEAVLANPLPDLPEVLRLGWLLSQLNAELPMYLGEMRRERAFRIAALATLPLVLSAAEDVELARADQATLARALEAWHVETEDPGVLAATLFRWWQTYVETRPSWPVALAALDRMA